MHKLESCEMLVASWKSGKAKEEEKEEEEGRKAHLVLGASKKRENQRERMKYGAVRKLN